MKRVYKKIIALLLMLTMLTPAYNTLAEQAVYYGDVNNDNTVNAEDALAVLKHAAKIEMIDTALEVIADVNTDKNLDAADALMILQFAAHIIDNFPGLPAYNPEESIEPTDVPTETPIIEPTDVPTETPTIEPTETPTAAPTETPTVEPTATPTVEPTPTATAGTGDTEMLKEFSGNVWIFGDSIAAHHEKTASVRPLYGWGELFEEYFTDYVTVNNHGISSQSTSSYYNLYRTTYDYVFHYMKENDYVFISFGHNDHNSNLLNGFNRMTDPEASSDTENSYKWWLKNYYIDPVLEKGAVPILMSSIVRCNFKDNKFYEYDVHMKYGTAMEELVAEYAEQGIKIYYIDAQDYTYNLYSTLTYEEAKLYHGQYGSEASYYFDNTHFSEAGARMIIDYMISELKKTDLGISKYLKQ